MTPASGAGYGLDLSKARPLNCLRL